ncbi:LysR family transcriptional regulator [Hymenobacter cellulosilyticus]|uniref:LysR family transcriptional regulator n=1 Tax=Hymenobacter cellulosilyticus TaxID=2932248 RepID=A0A8T9Q4X5_9BACT|nr:LysR family transcriptional regulator [Hymenobacter cellulosilyticus]UOQ72736.1 LysR family transcriptional regulator [Hymenobacter cellulosilyticus]
MEIRHLRVVKAIVEEGSIVRAIDKLHLTPSALSHQLREAENQVGAPIFFRINKKLVLTPVGERVLSRAYAILGELDTLQKEVKELIGGEVGRIRLSTECYTSYHWLPAMLRRFNADFPHVEVSINFEATHQPLPKLLSGHIDLAITSDPVPETALEFVELFRDELVAVVPAGHPWTEKPYVTAQDFALVNLIIHSLPLETVTVFQKLLTPAVVSPAKLTVLPLTEASIELVKADMGVVVMAQWALKPYLASPDLRTVRITPEGLWRQQYAARLRNHDYPLYYESFIQFLAQEIQF